MADKGVMWQLLLDVRVFKHLQQEILLEIVSLILLSMLLVLRLSSYQLPSLTCRTLLLYLLQKKKKKKKKKWHCISHPLLRHFNMRNS